MPTIRTPRHGSMQFWPRKRAHRQYARIRSWVNSTIAQPLGFAGYKVGMTTVVYEETFKKGKVKSMEKAIPVTIVECPPLKVASIRFYKKDSYGQKVVGEIFGKTDKELARKINFKESKKKIEDFKAEELDEVRINVYTQPKLTGIGKKKPELFEIGLGGNVEEQLSYAKEHLGKEIDVASVFKEGEQVDIHAITTGRGFQGPVKRFGIGFTSHKAEKARRNPGSLGGWKAQGHFMYRIAHAGQMGYHTRTDYNKWLLKISDKPDEINPAGGFIKYGFVKNTYILLKGSVPGPSKRIIKFTKAMRENKKVSNKAPELTYISLISRQRR